MSLLAEFDWVLEVSNPTLLDQIKRNITINETALNPPVDLAFPISDDIRIEAHMILEDVTLDLMSAPFDAISLKFIFSSGSLTFSSEAVGGVSVNVISDLAGHFTVRAPVVPVFSDSEWSVGVNLELAEVSVEFASDSMDKIGGGPLVAEEVKTRAENALEHFFRPLHLIKFPFLFNVDSGQDGSFSPLRFVRLEVHCISHEDPDRQALAVFGILLKSNADRGNYRAKTDTAIPPGKDVCMSLSPEAFHSKIFCENIAKTVGNVDASRLPRSCGSADGIAIGPVTLTSLVDLFSNGHIDVFITGEASGFCWEVTIFQYGRITFEQVGTELTPKISLDPITADFSIPWYCVVAATILAGGYGLITAGAADAVGQAIAQDFADSSVNNFGGELSGDEFSGVGGVTFETASITPGGLTVCGTVPRTQWRPKIRAIGLSGSVVTVSRTLVSTGTVKRPPSSCPDHLFDPNKTYSFTEWTQDQIGTYEVVLPTLLGRPLSYKWWITSGNNRVELAGSRDTARITVEAMFESPGGQGSWVTLQAQIGYTINDNVIKLTNVPADGYYSFHLNVEATDPSGHSAQAYAIVIFTGQWIEYEAGYYSASGDCMREILRSAREERVITIKDSRDLPPPPPPDHPPFEDLLDFVYKVITTDTNPNRAQQLIMTDARVAYGGLLESALMSQEAMESWLLKRRMMKNVKTYEINKSFGSD